MFSAAAFCALFCVAAALESETHPDRFVGEPISQHIMVKRSADERRRQPLRALGRDGGCRPSSASDCDSLFCGQLGSAICVPIGSTFVCQCPAPNRPNRPALLNDNGLPGSGSDSNSQPFGQPNSAIPSAAQPNPEFGQPSNAGLPIGLPDGFPNSPPAAGLPNAAPAFGQPNSAIPTAAPFSSPLVAGQPNAAFPLPAQPSFPPPAGQPNGASGLPIAAGAPLSSPLVAGQPNAAPVFGQPIGQPNPAQPNSPLTGQLNPAFPAQPNFPLESGLPNAAPASGQPYSPSVLPQPNAFGSAQKSQKIYIPKGLKLLSS